MFKNILFIFCCYSFTWFILSGSISYWLLAIGLLTACIGVATTKLDISRKKMLRILGYSFWLIKEITKSTYQVLKAIYQFPLQYKSGFKVISTDIRIDTHKIIFANSITLTPGTITVDIENDKLLIHALNEQDIADIPGSDMELRIIKFDK